MGRLLVGVAHELNNPLTVVTGRAHLLRTALDGGPLAGEANKIVAAAERCARIVKNFLALARQHPPERRRTNLNQIALEAVELLAYPLRVDDVQVRFDLADDLPLLWADPHQLHQVVVNLITNAHQAMRGSDAPRRLTLTTRIQADEGRALLRVTDTGPGIPPAVQARMFEPFFTTKPHGVGTGLGLSICQGIVESHGGRIQVYSEPGAGAIFTIELPVVVPPEGERAAVHALKAGPPMPGKAILIVDDEPDVAAVLVDVLVAAGHHVETVGDGAAALDKIRERSYDLILSDVRMPGLDGPGFYRAVEQRDPWLLRRFVFLTGDTLSADTREFLKGTGTATVAKPFDFEVVRRVVERALREPQPSGLTARVPPPP